MSWRDFLRQCEVRDRADGVIAFGRTNCNYIVFPTGLLIENFGCQSRVVMAIVRERGWKRALNALKDEHKRFEAAVAALRKPPPQGTR